MWLELHGFSDATSKAVAAVVYLRAVMSNGDVVIAFIASKTKINPLTGKPTIPKLELIACVLLAKLVKSVRDALQYVYVINEIFCWTDSLDCVFWITKR